MPAKVTYEAGPFPDRRAQHAEEVARVRLFAASAVRVAFGVVAVFLALGVLMTVSSNFISSTNPLVEFVVKVDTWFQGPFSRDNGVFSFTGHNADKFDALFNWGAAALVYLGVGSLLRAILRPRGYGRHESEDEDPIGGPH